MISCFKVKEQSMEPWAREGDFVLVDKMSYLFFKPKVGHVVVVRHPQRPNLFLLKRIVQESEGMYSMKGDNALKSIDSRHFGLVLQSSIMGRAYIVNKPRTKSRFYAGLHFA